jgi:ankyrin repeat protein
MKIFGANRRSIFLLIIFLLLGAGMLLQGCAKCIERQSKPVLIQKCTDFSDGYCKSFAHETEWREVCVRWEETDAEREAREKREEERAREMEKKEEAYLQSLTGLHKAAINGRVDEVKRFIDEGADINAKDSRGKTPADLAFEKSHMDIVIFLAEQKDGVDGTIDGVPLIHFAAANGEKGAIERLLTSGADIHSQDKSKFTPLHLAALNGKFIAAEFLIKKGADVNAKDEFGYIPLHKAALKGNIHVVELLIDKGSNVFTVGGVYQKPWDLASENGHKDVADMLRKVMDRKEKENALTLTALHKAAASGQINEVKRLLEGGADLDAKDSLGKGAMDHAADNGHKDILKLLMENTNSPNDTVNDFPIITIAAANGYINIVKRLVKMGARDVQDALSSAAWSAHKEVVEFLIANGANANHSDRDGRTPLHDAASQNYPDIVKVLLANGADVNARDNDKWTPLLNAAFNGAAEAAEVLITYGANINAKTESGFTSLYWAKLSDSDALVDLLKRHGAE